LIAVSTSARVAMPVEDERLPLAAEVGQERKVRDLPEGS
jgi:hypothetical protein